MQRLSEPSKRSRAIYKITLTPLYGKRNLKNDDMNTNKLALRIIASPFLLGLLIITYAYNCGTHFLLVMRWGGEWVTYKKDDHKTISKVFDLLKENQLK